MYLPFYESFKAWTKDYTDYDSNAQYYNLTADATVDRSYTILGQNAGQTLALNPNLKYTSVWQSWNTYANNAGVTIVDNKEVEKSIVITSEYKHYGVYPEDLFTGGAKNQFKLVFASLLNHSTLKMAEGSESLIASAGNNVVFISNDDLNFTTPMKGKFFLFDDLNENGLFVERKELNKLSFNEAQRPFADDIIKFSAKDKNGETEHTIDPVKPLPAWNIDPTTGERTIKIGEPTGTNIALYTVPAVSDQKDTAHKWTSADVVKGHKGGIAIQLPNTIEDQQEIEFTLTVKDALGFTNNVKFVVKKIK